MRTTIAAMFATLLVSSPTACLTPPSPDVGDTATLAFDDGNSLLDGPGPLATEDAIPDRLSESEAAGIIRNAFPNLDFGEDILYGEEPVDGEWYPAYMMSAEVGPDVIQVIVDAETGEILKRDVLEGYNAMASACTLTAFTSGTKYDQCASSWGSTKLGNSTSYTICSAGCVITDLAMIYKNLWKKSEDPSTVNSYGKSAGCFGSGSAEVNIDCAIDEHGAHSVTSVALSDLAKTICAGSPILFKRVYGSGYHYLLGVYYSGGSTSSTSSYKVIDPLGGKYTTLYGTAASSSPYRTVK